MLGKFLTRHKVDILISKTSYIFPSGIPGDMILEAIAPQVLLILGAFLASAEFHNLGGNLGLWPISQLLYIQSL